MGSVSVRVCAAAGGIPTVSDKSPTGVICDGGDHDGKPVDLNAAIEPHNIPALRVQVGKEITELKGPVKK